VLWAPDLATWWRSLNDEELNSLVDRAVKSNLDLEIALDRLQQARTYEAVVVGDALPTVDASAAAGRGTGSDLTKGRVDQALRSADNGAGLQHINKIAGFDVVWELDVALATRELATLEAQLAPVEAQVSAAQYTLAVLVGEHPDIQVAERELAANTARIGVATANLFPQVTLSAAIGSQGQGWGTSARSTRRWTLPGWRRTGRRLAEL
jgi:outer membrane protein TolC